MTTSRARSRLKPTNSPAPSRQRAAKSIALPDLKLLTRYFKFLPLLVLAGLFYTGLYWLMINVRPVEINSFLLPNSFLPFHLLFGLGNFFLFTFLTLSKRWGIFITLAIQWLILLKLQAVVWDGWAFGSALLIGAGGWWLRTLWKNRHASL